MTESQINYFLASIPLDRDDESKAFLIDVGTGLADKLFRLFPYANTYDGYMIAATEYFENKELYDAFYKNVKDTTTNISIDTYPEIFI